MMRIREVLATTLRIWADQLKPDARALVVITRETMERDFPSQGTTVLTLTYSARRGIDYSMRGVSTSVQTSLLDDVTGRPADDVIDYVMEELEQAKDNSILWGM